MKNLWKNLCLLIAFFVFPQIAWCGERYALVVGVADYPQVSKLLGSVRDANLMAKMFESQGFTEVKLLTNKQATRQAIFAAFTYFQAKVKAGDTFYFYFAGHGTVFPDDKSVERDEILTMIGEIDEKTKKPLFPRGKYDVAICPFDHKLNTSGKPWGNNILDDELYDEFAKFAAKDCYTVLFSDSCYSGTLGRNTDTQTRSYRFLTPDEAFFEPVISPVTRNAGEPTIFKIPTIESRAEKLKWKFISLTAAADTQLAEEKYFDSVTGEMGIFTYYLLEILRANPKISFEDLAQKLDTKVKGKNERQTVQIEKRFFRGDLKQTAVIR